MIPRKIKKHRVDELSNQAVTTYLVSGEEVRDWVDPALCLGGHDLVYKWIPKCEVWVENHMSHRETDTIAFHELRERSMMQRGLTYLQAHNIAEAEETRLRHQAPEKLAVALHRALKANKVKVKGRK